MQAGVLLYLCGLAFLLHAQAVGGDSDQQATALEAQAADLDFKRAMGLRCPFRWLLNARAAESLKHIRSDPVLQHC